MFKFIHSLFCDLAWVSFLTTAPATFIPHAICGHSFRAPQCSSPSINSKRIKPQLLTASIMHNIFVRLVSSSMGLSFYENCNSDGFPPTLSSPENNSLRKQHKNRFSCSEKRLNTDRMASSPQAQCVTEKTKPTKLSSRRRMKSPYL